MVSTMVSRSKSRILGDALAAVCGVVFFGLSVGFEKIDPRNLNWLTFGDQRAQLLGWWFFADDRWRWPLGANPRYGWEQMNSIVFTDSIPGLAFIFKLLNLQVFNSGQYFGVSLLLGSIALFVGARRLFSTFGLGFWPAICGTLLLCTTPLFWWMQRWYVALSSGVAILVWATLFYVDDQVPLRQLWRRWTFLLVLAVAVQAYLLIPVVGFFTATLANRFITKRDKLNSLMLGFLGSCVLCVGAMYVFGYYTVPSKWSQTGGYGWYSANLLGLMDSNGASQILPNLPSISGQYEPTSLATGTLLLMPVLFVHFLRTKMRIPIRVHVSKHAPLFFILAVLSALAITNTVSLGSWSFKVPIPYRLEHGLSIFRSSARFFWPSIVVLTTFIVVLALRHLRHGLMLLVLVLVVQFFDYRGEFTTMSDRPDGPTIGIEFDQEFWKHIPLSYTKIAVHPAASLGQGWSECAFAAVQTNRIGECGYFGRVQGLESVNRKNADAMFSGELDRNTIYWISVDWLTSNRTQLLETYASAQMEVLVVRELRGLGGNSVLVFEGCGGSESCSLLRGSSQTLGEFLRNL